MTRSQTSVQPLESATPIDPKVVIRFLRSTLRLGLSGGLVAAALALGLVLLGGRKWTSVSTFVPVSADVAQGGLRSLAGQFGLQLPGGGAAPPPKFFADLAKSRSVLDRVTSRKYATAAGDSVDLADFLEVEGEAPGARRAFLREQLASKVITARVDRETGLVTVSATTEDALVSQQLLSEVVAAIDALNEGMRRSQASQERRFVEERLGVGRDELRAAEQSLQRFLTVNRQPTLSPELQIERDRIQREVGLRQQVVTTLSQSVEEARLREYRDTPVVSVVDAPTLPELPSRRFLALKVIVAFAAGYFLALLWSARSALLQFGKP